MTNIGTFLQHSDLDKVFIDLGDTITNLTRRSSSGDNYNVSTIRGEAFFEETYVHICWGRITLPLAEVLLTAVLLAVSIAIMRKEPFLKESVMVLLMSGLEGWSEDEMEMPRPQTQEKLDMLAENMRARYEADDLGHMRFQRD